MTNSEDKQKRQEKLKKGTAAIKNLNDLSSIRDRIKKEKSLEEQLEIVDEQDDLQKIASKSRNITPDKSI